MKPIATSRVYGAESLHTMMHELVYVGGAVGLAVMSFAVFAVMALGLVVWLAGSAWARRPPEGPGGTLPRRPR